MKLSKRDLLMIGASLYYGEGTKLRVDNRGYKVHAVEFTNKEPMMVKMFLKFLRGIIKAEEERIKAELFIYPDHSEKKLKLFWSKITEIPLKRFNKTIKLRQRNIRYNPNPLGTMKIRYCHKKHFLKIMSIIEEIFGKKP